ncbi:adipose-secreted signaling protein [Lasioglossum baleicum]|uniref:adipose-secreted signaling protein n=1 Tax=Lasioglossum baleicum TaxID=434251 RepID=UPI003FCD1A86
MGDKEHHVHFSGGSSLVKDNNILIQPQRHGQIDAHLGFLQLYHKYLVEFVIPWNQCPHNDGKAKTPAISVGPINPNCRIIDFGQDKDGLKLRLEFLAYKEKILKEEVQISCCKAGTPLKIQLSARVLGKDKGTPLLRNGIRNIGVESPEEDEVLGTKIKQSLRTHSQQQP